MFIVPNVDNNPVMANLVAAIEHMEGCQLHLRMATENLQRHVGYVQPTAWTERIERAVASKNKLELDGLKVRRMSALVCYEAADLTFLYWQDEFKAAESRLMDAIIAATEAHQNFQDNGSTFALKTGLESNCVLGLRLIHKRGPRVDPNSENRHLLRDDHAGPCIWQAFTTLSKRLERYESSGSRHQVSYPTYQRGERELQWSDLGIPLSQLNGLALVPATDWIPDGYDSLKRLPEAVGLLSQHSGNAQRAYEQLRNNQRGRVNEAPHALRLLGVLDGSLSDEDTQKELERQRENRLDYQSARLVLSALQVDSYRAGSDLTWALLDAVKDVQRLAEEHGTTKEDVRDHNSKLTRNRLELAMRVGAVNCLVTDYLLHVNADERDRHNDEFNQDLTQGAGARAVQDYFAPLLKRGNRRSS